MFSWSAPAGARVALLGALAGFILAPAAQAYLTEDQFQELVKVTTELSPLGDNAFGEHWSPYSGELSFAQTDVDFAGTGLSIVLQRTKDNIGQSKSPSNGNGAFGDWSLNIPRITTLTPDYTAQQATTPPAPEEWTVEVNGAVSYARCTAIGPPTSGQLFDPYDWWNGYEFSTPESGSSTLLVRNAAVPVPTGIVAGSTPITNFTGTTTSNWVAGCGINTANEAVGREGFLVVSPSGVKYWMNWIAYYDTPSINLGSDGVPNMPQISSLKRKMAHLSVTRMEDRFGNYLTFSYAGNNLTSITSSDGRTVTLTWRFDLPKPVVDYITVQPSSGDPRTWTYTYSVDAYSKIHLTNVTLPDLSKWSFALSNLDDSTPLYSTHYSCTSTSATFPTPSNAATTYTGSITHPSGMVGTFIVKPIRHGRAYVPLYCSAVPSGSITIYEPVYPNLYDTASLVSKSYSTGTWTYSYGTPNASWSTCTSNCGGTVDTTVTQNDGSKIRQVFSNRYDTTEGKEVGTYAYDTNGTTLLQTIASQYEPYNAGPWPANFGNNLQPRSGPNVNTITPLSLKQTTAHYAGGVNDTYTADYLEFDEFGQAEHVDASNSIAGQASNSTDLVLRNDYTYWLVGLTEKATVNNSTTPSEQTDYDPLSRPIARYRFGLKYRTIGYDSLGRITSIKDGLEHQTSLSNFKIGQPQHFVYADGTFADRVINDFGEVTSVTLERTSTSEAPVTTGYARDDMGRITKVAYPTGDTQSWSTRDLSYTQLTASELGWSASRWRVEDKEGNYRKRTYYDAAWRPGLIEEMDLATGVARYQRTSYDFRNNPTQVVFPAAAATAPGWGTLYAYDGLGRQIKRESFLASGTTTLDTTSYVSGNRRTVTDPRSLLISTTTTYQAFGEPAYENALLIEAPEGQTTTIARDVFGNMTSATQSGLYSGSTVSVTRSYVYDANMRLCKRIEPETGQSVMQYDNAGNVTWTADGQSGSSSACDHASVPDSAKTSFGYDLRNRVTSANAPGTDADVTTTYWPTGDVKTIATPATTWTYNYNKRRLLEDETLAADAINFKLDYGYNTQGVLSQLVYPSNRSISLSPNALGQSRAVGSYVTGASYHPTGTISTFAYGNGLNYSLTLDARQRPERLKVLSGSTARVDLTHYYDLADNLATIDDQASGADDRSLAYDDLNRLERATGLWGTYDYAYDPLNNLRARSGPSALTYAYNAGTNRLSGVTGGVSRSYSYNAEGQVTGDGAKSFTWNGAGRITNVAGVASYAYDGLGKRFKTTRQGGEIEYTIYSRAGTMLYSYKPGTGEFVDYAYLGSLPVVEIKTVPGGTVAEAVENPPIATVLNMFPGLPPQVPNPFDTAQDVDPTGETQPAQTTITYLHADLLNSPVQASASTGSLLWQEHYQPYGQKMNGVAEKLGYTAHVFDDNTGLTYMQARFYDPQVGRFISTDPMEFGGEDTFAFNRYAYANGNPYRFTDPTGMQSCKSMGYISGPGGNCSDSGSGGAQAGNGHKTAQVGAVVGAMAGLSLAAACDVSSAGVCALGNPAIIGAATMAGMATGEALERAWSQLNGLLDKVATSGPQEYQYALLAKAPGLYPDVRNGVTYLNAGDVWKYGTSYDPDSRYSNSARATLGLTMEVQSRGTRSQVLVQEKIMLIQHFATHGTLPPGNKIFK